MMGFKLFIGLKAVVALRVIGGQNEIVWVELERFAVKAHGFFKNLLHVDLVIIRGVVAKEINRGRQVMPINRLSGIELNGLFVVLERFLDRAVMAVPIRDRKSTR